MTQRGRSAPGEPETLRSAITRYRRLERASMLAWGRRERTGSSETRTAGDSAQHALWASVVGVLRAYIRSQHAGAPTVAQALHRFSSGAGSAEALPPHLLRKVGELTADLAREQEARAFPTEVANLLAGTLEDLLTGSMPKALQRVTRKGAPGYGPLELECISAAIRYVRSAQHAELGPFLKDRTPRKKVLHAYGITADTWGDWALRIKTDPRLALAADIDRLIGEAGPGIGLAALADLVRQDMLDFSDVYRKHGRRRGNTAS